jgi:MinD superfamily P-loop ATPase
MHDAKELNRRDFLKFIPKYLAYSVHTFTKELSKPPDIRTGTGDVEPIDDRMAKVARIDTDCCLAWEGGSCQFCYLVCPLRDKAITMEDQKPRINSSICDGCAKCMTACQTVNTILAIRMVAVG